MKILQMVKKKTFIYIYIHINDYFSNKNLKIVIFMIGDYFISFDQIYF